MVPSLPTLAKHLWWRSNTIFGNSLIETCYILLPPRSVPSWAVTVNVDVSRRIALNRLRYFGFVYGLDWFLFRK
jgi:hypothetical protein